MKKILVLLIFMLLLVNFVRADIVVTRDSKTNINLGEAVDIKISIFNNESSDKEAILIEQVSKNAELIQPKRPSYTVSVNKIQYFKWHIILPSKKISVFTYTIKPLNVGVYESAPTKVTIENKTYLSDSLSILVNCLSDGYCDNDENYLNCKEDCKSGSLDGYCDALKDGVCDKDCSLNADLDCEFNEEKISVFDRILNFLNKLFK